MVERFHSPVSAEVSLAHMTCTPKASPPGVSSDVR